MAYRLDIPTINDDLEDFGILFNLWREVSANPQALTFDFTECRFLRQNAVAFLGGLYRLSEHLGGNPAFLWDTLQKDVKHDLYRHRFVEAFGGKKAQSTSSAIPYRQDIQKNHDEMINYLKNEWLGHGGVHVSDALRNAICGVVWEIYTNAFEHGESQIGIFSCGQYYQNKKDLKLTVIDFGVGIPKRVRDHVKSPNLPSESALKWAFIKGMTTKAHLGGLGLKLLQDFVVVNNGRLEVYSHNGYAKIDAQGEQYAPIDSFFQGTLMNISLRCDERYYVLASEVPDRFSFEGDQT